MAVIVCVTTSFKKTGEAVSMELPKNKVVKLPNQSSSPTNKASLPLFVCGGLKTPYLVLKSPKTLSEKLK